MNPTAGYLNRIAQCETTAMRPGDPIGWLIHRRIENPNSPRAAGRYEAVRRSPPMRPNFYFLSLPLVLALFITGCEASPPDEPAAQSTAALVNLTRWCFAPQGHPIDDQGDVWIAELRAGFGPTDPERIVLQTAEYWAGRVVSTGGPETKAWPIRTTNVGADIGWHLQADVDADGTSVAIDLSGDPEAGQGLTGTVTRTAAWGTREITPIVAGHRCPAN
jgi:hypothetical protein